VLVRLGFATDEDLRATQAEAGAPPAGDAGTQRVVYSREQLENGKTAVTDVVVALALAASKGEAKRLIKQGGVYVDGDRIKAIDAAFPLKPAGSLITLRVGKKRYGLVELVD